eukprot:m.56132 g.56132  ORF g.56132 m.56132 type:complete len:196 (-) comp15566_c0_seq1:48-635(-)
MMVDNGKDARRLRQFWTEHSKPFSTWFLLKLPEDRLDLIKKCGPDLPQERPQDGDELKPTDVLLPELTIHGMTACDGKLFILFITRRVMESAYANDMKMLRQLHDKKAMPILSNGQFDHLKLAFVDPCDPEENVLGLAKDCTDEKYLEMKKKIEDGVYIDADVWLARKLRQSAILQFLLRVVDVYEADVREGRWP